MVTLGIAAIVVTALVAVAVHLSPERR